MEKTDNRMILKVLLIFVKIVFAIPVKILPVVVNYSGKTRFYRNEG